VSENGCESYPNLEYRHEQAGVQMTKLNRKEDWFSTSHHPLFLSVRKSPPVLSKTRYYLELETETEAMHNLGEEILFHNHDASYFYIPTEGSSQSSLIRCFQRSSRFSVT